MPTYEWLVERMETYPQRDGFVDCVFNVFWRVNAYSDALQSTLAGQQAVQLEPNEEYTPFNQLTQAQVISWVKSAMGQGRVAEIENNLSSLIQNQTKPPVISPPLPW